MVAGTLKDPPDGVTSAIPSVVILDHAYPVPPLFTYVAKPHDVPGKLPLVLTVSAGVCVNVTAEEGLKARYSNAVPIDDGRALGNDAPLICA